MARYDRDFKLKCIKAYEDGELEPNQTVAKNATVQKEGNKTVRKTVEFYNLDVIISVGYRVKSQNRIIFRKWANSVLPIPQ